ncbi:MAG: TatD family hydrolase [Acidiferrobacterales bacterium]|nr:TatD family hydrolase [Acidiferrobacterales bacterium]
MIDLVDSHCHINFDPLGDEVEQVIQRAHEKGVNRMICVSVNLEDYPQVLDLAIRYDNVFASVGVHPNEQEGRDPGVAELLSLAVDEHVVAIGETGLDYYRTEEKMDWQHDRFRRHIEVAKQCGKPLIIHTRDSSKDTLKLMEEEGARDAGGVMHCFVEDWDTAKRAMDLDFYISFSGIVTFKNAKELQEVAKRVPLDRMLVETDSPYLAPVPYRGKTNEPAYTRNVAEFIADLRGMELEALAAATTANCEKLFSLQ